MVDVASIFIFFILYFWWVFIILAVAITGFVLMSMRTIINKVLFIRGMGRSMELRRCQIKGTHIRFRPNPKGPEVSVPIIAPPSMWVKWTTYRVYCIIEGSGQTSNIGEPNGVKGKATGVFKYVDKKTGQLVTMARMFQNVPFGTAMSPTLAAASSSLSMFESGVQQMVAGLPKSKAEVLLWIVIFIIGLFGGLAWGGLLFRGH